MSSRPKAALKQYVPCPKNGAKIYRWGGDSNIKITFKFKGNFFTFMQITCMNNKISRGYNPSLANKGSNIVETAEMFP